MTELPDWMHPPRAEGWLAEDLDHLPDAPRHTELIHGALVFLVAPLPCRHGEVVTLLAAALREQVPSHVRVGREMTVKLDERNRLAPDLLVTTADHDGDRTWFTPDEVRLVIEVVSPESAHRDRTVKLRKYAEAGIRHYWCVEDESGAPVVHVYELDEATSAYAPAGIFRGVLKRPVPFEISLDLDKLGP
ncbi:Uma2 family endonuclease [Streptomyces sp. NPDC058001]|uniref:Uma2 family endonuclease n=1 Tax=Streptomyces sp. NPDC058001 TaxID=3346300 RepID=UPI0036E8E110